MSDQGAPKAVDLAAEVRQAVDALGGRSGRGSAVASARPVTSDLTIDESLCLHSVGWEPLSLVSGAGSFCIPQGSWTWTPGEVFAASHAVNEAFHHASRRLTSACSHAGGSGVVGAHIELELHPHRATVVITGTAIVPSGQARSPSEPFVSDLSGRDFSLLLQSGWMPTGIAYGVCYVHAPRRSMGAAMSQAGQNVELANLTAAMYQAREQAMARMQQAAVQATFKTSHHGRGVVAVQVHEGPVHFSSHSVGFRAWGTAVILASESHTYLAPRVAVPLDDLEVSFDAASLRK